MAELGFLGKRLSENVLFGKSAVMLLLAKCFDIKKVTIFFWLSLGSHLNVPGVTREGEVCLKLIAQVNPLNTGNLRF